MSLGVAPHAAVPTSHNVMAVATTATVPGGKLFVPSTHGAAKTRKHYELNSMRPEVSIGEVENHSIPSKQQNGHKEARIDAISSGPCSGLSGIPEVRYLEV